jgi:hypothetical protein
VRSQLGALLLRLTQGDVRASAAGEEHDALVAVRVPQIPRGLSEEQRRRIDGWRERSARVRSVLVADRGRPPVQALPVAPDIEKVILVP